MTVQDFINELQRMVVDGKVQASAEVRVSVHDGDFPLFSDDLMVTNGVTDPEGRPACRRGQRHGADLPGDQEVMDESVPPTDGSDWECGPTCKIRCPKWKKEKEKANETDQPE